MQRSGPASIIVTALIGLVLTPVALGLISAGGGAWYRLYATYFSVPPLVFEVLTGPVLQFVLGLILLAAVIITGRWSPGGLFAAGAIGLVSLLFCLVPAVFREFIGVFFVNAIPIEWSDGLIYGQTQIVCLTLGAMGIARLQMSQVPMNQAPVNQGPRPSSTKSVIAIGAAIVAIPAGCLIAVYGVALTLARAMQTFRFQIDIVGATLLVVGLTLLMAGVILSRWSPFALIGPTVLLVGVTAFSYSRSWFYFVPGNGRLTAPFFTMGGGIALGLALLVFMVVLLWSQATPAARAWPPQTPPQHPQPPQPQPQPQPQPGMFTFPPPSGR